MPELTEDRVREILSSFNNDPKQLTAALLDIQEASGKSCVERRWAELAAHGLGVPPTLVYEILTFYSMFATSPRGRHVVEVCRSAPCHFLEAGTVLGWFEEALSVKCGETTPDGLFTLVRTSCVGSCDTGPAVRVGDEIYGGLTREKAQRLIQSYREGSPQLREGL